MARRCGPGLHSLLSPHATSTTRGAAAVHDRFMALLVHETSMYGWVTCMDLLADVCHSRECFPIFTSVRVRAAVARSRGISCKIDDPDPGKFILGVELPSEEEHNSSSTTDDMMAGKSEEELFIMSHAPDLPIMLVALVGLSQQEETVSISEPVVASFPSRWLPRTRGGKDTTRQGTRGVESSGTGEVRGRARDQIEMEGFTIDPP